MKQAKAIVTAGDVAGKHPTKIMSALWALTVFKGVRGFSFTPLNATDFEIYMHGSKKRVKPKDGKYDVKEGVNRGLNNEVGKVGDNVINSVAGDVRKFSEYALVNHSKTGLFIDSWGYKPSDADNLLSIYKNQAIKAVREGKVIPNGGDGFGNQIYKIETILNTPLKGDIKIYAGWIIKPNKIDEIILSTPFDGFVK